MSRLTVTVVGGGILGLWQALTLAQRGHAVTLREAAPEDGSGAASRMAGAMLAPYCESETAEPIIKQLGLRGLELWRQTYPGAEVRGSRRACLPMVPVCFRQAPEAPSVSHN